MVNKQYLDILLRGQASWNDWRREYPLVKVNLRNVDLRGLPPEKIVYSLQSTFKGGNQIEEIKIPAGDLAHFHFHDVDLRGANLAGCALNSVVFWRADLRGADLTGCDLAYASFYEARLDGAILDGADLDHASFAHANLTRARLVGARLNRANLIHARLTRAVLSGSDLRYTLCDGTDFTKADISGCSVYGISAWNITLDEAIQNDLVITSEGEPVIKVDNLEVAQFVYLLLNNNKIRDVIHTIGNRAVLVLGRFSDTARKAILDAIRDKLRVEGFLPIVFDFERATERDFTETIKILVGMSLFVIADITAPRSTPLELQATVPDYLVPFVPIIQKGEFPFAMFVDLQRKYPWMMEVRAYETKDQLMDHFVDAVIKPALERHNQLLVLKNKELRIRDIDDF